MTLTPRLFLGSSTEGRARAEVFARVLSEAATVVPWWTAPEFTEQHTTIQALLAAVDTYDFAVALFTPDDSITSRGQVGTSVRDNVIFEYGLFLGQLGPARTFAFTEIKGTITPKTPTDLLGVTIPRFNTGPGRNLAKSIENAVDPVLRVMKARGLRELRWSLIDSWGPEGKEFTAKLTKPRLERYERHIRGHTLVLAVRKRNPRINASDDPQVWFDARKVTDVDNDIHLVAVLPSPEVKAQYDFHLYVAPGDFKVELVRTIGDIVSAGGRQIEAHWVEYFEQA